MPRRFRILLRSLDDSKRFHDEKSLQHISSHFWKKNVDQITLFTESKLYQKI